MMEKKTKSRLEVTVSFKKKDWKPLRGCTLFSEESPTCKFCQFNRYGDKFIRGTATCKLGGKTEEYSFICYLSKENEVRWDYAIQTPSAVRKKIENAYKTEELVEMLRNTDV